MLRTGDDPTSRMPDIDAEVDVVAVTPPPEEKKNFCQRCLNHGQEFPRKGHKPHCQFASCTCEQCAMVETRRQLNNKLSKRKEALAAGAKGEVPKGKKVRDPHCARCGQHGIETPLKGHNKKCQFVGCECDLCALVCNRRNVMARQIKLRRDQKRARESLEGRRSIDSDTGNSSDGSKEPSVSPAPPPLPVALAHPQPLRPQFILPSIQQPPLTLHFHTSLLPAPIDFQQFFNYNILLRMMQQHYQSS